MGIAPKTATKLSVNVNKIATLRNARGKDNPNVVKTAVKIVGYGAHGITVHPRPDERHITFKDVFELKTAVTGGLHVELNVEGFPSDDFLKLISDVRPSQCTLVPDPPEAITSNAGWLIKDNAALLGKIAEQLRTHSVRSSVFVDPKTCGEAEFAVLRKIGIDRVELYTESFAEAWKDSPDQGLQEILAYRKCAELARAHGLGVNAGHDLDLHNLAALISHISFLDEVSIGHALICDALEFGMEQTIRKYLDCIQLGHRRVSVQG